MGGRRRPSLARVAGEFCAPGRLLTSQAAAHGALVKLRFVATSMGKDFRNLAQIPANSPCWGSRPQVPGAWRCCFDLWGPR